MKKLFLILTATVLGISIASAQCTPDSTVTSTGFKVSDTCAINGQPFNSIITIYVPDTILVPPSTRVAIDSLVIDSLKLGVGTGLNVTYKNGIKTVKANQPFCAVIGAPTVAGAVGTYSTNASGNFKISFSARAYKGGAVILPLSETILGAAELEIKFKIVAKAADCLASSSISSLNIEGLEKLNVTPNPVKSEAKVSFTSDKNAAYKMKITNIIGNVVSIEDIKVTTGTNEFSIDANHLSKGIYFLNIFDGSNSVSKKFVVNY